MGISDSNLFTEISDFCEHPIDKQMNQNYLKFDMASQSMQHLSLSGYEVWNILEKVGENLHVLS